jgi:predicted metal-dependent TIM-barrel fold hydrolase
MVSRTTDDYEQLALAGCAPDGFHDYFRQLTDTEPKRAAKFGIPHFCWLCINPKEADDPGFAREVMALLPEFLDRPNVLGIGEIGLNKNTRNELLIFEEHVQLALVLWNAICRSSSTRPIWRTSSRAPG